jgi:L-threonylcarbamoyladenylate synthase
MLIEATNMPLAAPSANKSGRISPTTPRHVQEELGNAVPVILSGGACEIGIESTVLDISDGSPRLLRPGSVTREQLEETLLPFNVKLKDPVQNTGSDGAVRSPGQLESHYAPSLPVRLNVTLPKPGEALLAFGKNTAKSAKKTVNLSVKGDLREAAACLFASLRALDTPDFTAIAVVPIPEEGLGAAINDRLRRAAASRDKT